MTVSEPVVTRQTNGVTLAGFSETSGGSEENERSGELHDGGGIVRKGETGRPTRETTGTRARTTGRTRRRKKEGRIFVASQGGPYTPKRPPAKLCLPQARSRFQSSSRPRGPHLARDVRQNMPWNAFCSLSVPPPSLFRLRGHKQRNFATVSALVDSTDHHKPLIATAHMPWDSGSPQILHHPRQQMFIFQLTATCAKPFSIGSPAQATLCP